MRARGQRIPLRSTLTTSALLTLEARWSRYPCAHSHLHFKNTDFDVTDLDGLSDDEEKSTKVGSLPHFDLPELDDRELSVFFEHPMIKTAFAEGVGALESFLLTVQ